MNEFLIESLKSKDWELFESLVELAELNETLTRPNRIGRTELKKSKHSIFQNQQQIEKLAKGIESKLRLYMKKERMAESEKEKYISEFVKVVEKACEMGSLPLLDSNKFMVSAGDIMRDIFPDYAVDYKTMEQVERSVIPVAIRVGILPKGIDKQTVSEIENAVKEMVDFIVEKCPDFVEKFNTPTKTLEYELIRVMERLPWNMDMLNDSHEFYKALAFSRDLADIATALYSGSDQKEFFELFVKKAKEIYKFK